MSNDNQSSIESDLELELLKLSVNCEKYQQELLQEEELLDRLLREKYKELGLK